MKQPQSVSPHFTSLLQLTITLLVVSYMLFIGGSFNGTVNYRVQLLNAVGGSVIALAWLLWHLWRRAFITKTGLELPLALFIASQWIATLTSSQPRLSLDQAVAATAWVITFIFLCDLLAQHWPQRFFENALLLAALLIVLQALIEIGSWFAGWFQIGLWPLVVYRVNGFLGHPNLTAATLNLILPIIIFRIFRTSSRLQQIVLSILMLGLFVVEFFTSSRSGWIGAATLVLTLFGLLMFGQATQIRLQLIFQKFGALPLGIRLAGASVCLVLLIGAGYGLWLQTLHPSHPEFFSSRQYIWGPAWANFLAQPLTGGGPGLYTWFYPRFTSIPPEWLAPHAHSLLFQTLSDTGLIGLISGIVLLVSGAIKLWQSWLNSSDRFWSACLIAGGVGWFVHHIFDYLFTTPAFLFIFIILAALALRPTSVAQTQTKSYSPLYLGLPILGLIGVAVFSLRAAALNDEGMQALSENNWDQAATAFEQAAQADPALALYWQNAAYAYTRANHIQTALPLWQRVVQSDPYWAIGPASLAVLKNDPTVMQTAVALAPHSDWLVLNAGALAESNGDLIGAEQYYSHILELNPLSANTLFWQQTTIRQAALLNWQNTHPIIPTKLEQGQHALGINEVPEAIHFFSEAQVESPTGNAPYLGLARAYWLAGDETQSQYYRKIAQLIPVTTPDQTMQLYLFDGDWAEAHGQRAEAIQAYKTVFSILNDYTYGGPGTYGYPQRYWHVYHRPTPPSDLVPQFVHANITAELDDRFLLLGTWVAEQGQPETACFVWSRVYAEAPQSESGQKWLTDCN